MEKGHPGEAMEIPWRFNMADYFLYDRIEEGKGDNIAIRTVEEAYTYEQVARESNRFGNVLQALGSRPEERVLLILPDVPAFAFGIFGTLRTGGVVAMANPLLDADDLAYYVEYTRCRTLVTTPGVAEKLAPRLDAFPRLSDVIVTGDQVPAGDRYHAWSDTVDEASGTLEAHPTTRNDPAYWLFTSGSTGEPKAAMHLHHDFPWNCERYAKGVLGYTEDDTTLSVPRLYFGYATGSNLFFPFSVGATTCLFPEKPTAGTILDHIERFEPTILTTVPTSINQVVHHETAEERDFSSLRFAISAGEALPKEVYERWMRLYGVEILDGIGSAESFHIYITNYPGDSVRGSLGHLVPGYEARIVDPNGDDVGVGDVGRLMVKGDSVAVGYWQRHEDTKETFQGGWIVTSDLFRKDEDGRFWYEGRADDILKVGGMFVSPLEIEDAVIEHEAVEEVAVVAYKEEGLSKPIAFVSLAKDHGPSLGLALELAGGAKEALARYKFPRRVAFVDALPRNDRGKVDRPALREKAKEASLAWFDTGTKALRELEGRA